MDFQKKSRLSQLRSLSIAAAGPYFRQRRSSRQGWASKRPGWGARGLATNPSDLVVESAEDHRGFSGFFFAASLKEIHVENGWKRMKHCRFFRIFPYKSCGHGIKDYIFHDFPFRRKIMWRKTWGNMNFTAQQSKFEIYDADCGDWTQAVFGNLWFMYIYTHPINEGFDI